MNPAISFHGNNYNHSSSVVVIQHHNYCTFNVYSSFLQWNIARIVWIGFYKNRENGNCFLDLLPKDVVKYIIKFLACVVADDDPDACIQLDTN